ncbi:MAG: sulfatase-like hydrolase/transferase [Gemmatimonadales bacterium]
MLLAPAWIAAVLIPDTAAPWMAVEAALVVAGMAVLPPGRWSRALAWVVASAVVLASAAAFADLVFWSSLGRPLNLSLDLYLIDAVYRLAVGNIGLLRTLGAAALIVVVGLGVVVLLARLLMPAAESSSRDPRVRRLGPALIATTALVWLAGLAVGPLAQRIRAPALSLARTQSALLASTRAERASFESELTRAPASYADVPALLGRLEGADVVIAYLESYGMAALEDPELATFVRPRLDVMATRLEAAGLHVASGRMVSPTVGGQSWYAHGTVTSGLWLSSQQRWELLLRSGRETLVDDFRRAGYRTATIMPAITTPWPEAVRLGFDEIYTEPSIPYAGPPFYWVTMPDQFTWSFVGDVLARETGPTFVEVAMVSSHAPWTPVLPLLDWDEIGDGAVFEQYRRDGHPPEELWWDVAELRAGYARSMAYSVAAMAEFAERYLDDRTLLVVLGDHQAAPWVTGAESPDVPVHVIARDPALIQPFVTGWGFTRGVLPAAGQPVHRMDELRAWFVETYSGEPVADEKAPAGDARRRNGPREP